jgi:predicted transcriptional regulator
MHDANVANAAKTSIRKHQQPFELTLSGSTLLEKTQEISVDISLINKAQRSYGDIISWPWWKKYILSMPPVEGYGMHDANVANAAKTSIRKHQQPFELTLSGSTLLEKRGRRNQPVA